MGSHHQFCLKWNSHQSNMLAVFEQLLSNEALVDVTLACEGLSLKAHKMVLSACSPYFQALFVENPCKHPIVILKDMRYMDLQAIIEYMYRGEVNVSQDQLSALLKTAETLKVKGLGEVTGEDKNGALKSEDGTDAKPVCSPRAESPPLKKRKRVRPRRRSLSGSTNSDPEDAPPAARIKRPESPVVDGSVTALPAESQTCSTAASSSTTAESESRTSSTAASSSTATESQSRTSSTAASSSTAVPSGAHIGSSAQATNSVDASQHTRHYVGEDAVEGGDADFEVDPSSLVKQSMTTENEPVFTDVPSSQALGNESKHLHHTGSTSDKSALVPVQASSPSDISISSQAAVKPPFSSSSTADAAPLGPTSSGDGACSGAMAVFVDKSGIPAVPGPSNYHPDERQQPELLGLETSDGELGALRQNSNDENPPLSCYVRTVGSKEGHGQSTGTRKKLLQCIYCNKSFVFKHTLERHLRCHTGERPYRCDHCGRSFAQSGTLCNHRKRHMGERPFQCQLCPMDFKRNEALERHMRVHKEEKPFQCQHCPNAFRAKYNLKCHEQAKHHKNIVA